MAVRMARMSGMSAWCWPFKACFSHGNKKKSQGDKSGEFGSSNSTVI